MQFAIYANVGNQQGQDNENQLDQLSHRVLREYHEVALFVDRQSGSTRPRPLFQDLLRSAARHEFQFVLVWALDRLVGESVPGTFGNIQKLRRCGVHVVSHTEPHFCTNGPAGDLMIPIAAWIAHQELLRNSQRTQAGLARARAKHQRFGRPPKVFARHLVVADRERGMSWRHLESKYDVPQSTLRKAIRNLADAGVRQLDDAQLTSPVSALEKSQ